jgi:Flp pilus assembly protein TadG
MSSRGRPCSIRFQRGQAATELAVSSLFLLLVLAGVMDMSRLYFARINLLGSAREGARHAAWFDTPNRRNPYLDDADIIAAVNTNLAGAGLPSVASNRSASLGACPTPSDGNAYANPPFDLSYYPTAVNQPYLYICYTPPSNPGCTLPTSPQASLTTAPTDNCWRLGDVDVVLLMKTAIMTPTLQNYLGSGVLVAASAHMTIGGKP